MPDILLVKCIHDALTFQVELHTSLEKSLPEFILRRVDKKEIVEYPNAHQAQLGILNWDRVFKYFQPKTSAKGYHSLH